MKRLRDRVAVVTGAASGIGRATALRLAEKGAHLALVDVNDRGLAEVRAEIERMGRRVSVHACDVSDRSRMEDLVRAVEGAHGSVQIVVNNAGVGVASNSGRACQIPGIFTGSARHRPCMVAQPCSSFAERTALFVRTR